MRTSIRLAVEFAAVRLTQTINQPCRSATVICRDSVHGPFLAVDCTVKRGSRGSDSSQTFTTGMAPRRCARHVQPDHAYTYADLGKTLEARGELEEAARAYREALRRKPDLDVAARSTDWTGCPNRRTRWCFTLGQPKRTEKSSQVVGAFSM